MTKKEAAIITAYTRIMVGEFSDFHKYIEEKLRRSVYTHELANEDIWNELKIVCKEDLANIKIV